jgi:hypothetical protein
MTQARDRRRIRESRHGRRRTRIRARAQRRIRAHLRLELTPDLLRIPAHRLGLTPDPRRIRESRPDLTPALRRIPESHLVLSRTRIQEQGRRRILGLRLVPCDVKIRAALRRIPVLRRSVTRLPANRTRPSAQWRALGLRTLLKSIST